MPLNRKWLQSQADAEKARIELVDELEVEIQEIQAELDEWSMSDSLVQRLSRMEHSALEAMLSSTPDEMISARERVKVIRELLSEKGRLVRRLTEKKNLLEQALNEE